jgi:hypothetical protein
MSEVQTARASFLIYLAAKGLRPIDLNAWEWEHYTCSFFLWMQVLALMPAPRVQTRTSTERR